MARTSWAAVPTVGSVIARRLQERLSTTGLSYDEVVLILEGARSGQPPTVRKGVPAPSTPPGSGIRHCVPHRRSVS